MEANIIKTIDCNQGIIIIYDNGICEKVYKDFKVSKSTMLEDIPARISMEIIDYFKKLGNAHFCEIYSVKQSNDVIESYMMQYYKEKESNILDCSSNYLFTNYDELYQLMFIKYVLLI